MGATMRIIIIVALCAASFVVTPAFAGNCNYSWQHAKDGSACGGRAADQRPGGN
jgi:hypothetical protein